MTNGTALQTDDIYCWLKAKKLRDDISCELLKKSAQMLHSASCCGTSILTTSNYYSFVFFTLSPALASLRKTANIITKKNYLFHINSARIFCEVRSIRQVLESSTLLFAHKDVLPKFLPTMMLNLIPNFQSQLEPDLTELNFRKF